MTAEDFWLLPEGIEEILPPAAFRLEALRRNLLDLFDRWGYELVIPPLVEHLEGLLSGTGHDLDLMTFKLTDPTSGRMLGVRADMTPQVTRIDARHSPPDLPGRWCYMGSVLHARGDGFGGSRSPIQVGAELYGHSGHESDLEIISLLLEVLRECGVGPVHLDLGHVGVFRALIGAAGVEPDAEQELFDALQRKAAAEIGAWLGRHRPSPVLARQLEALARLNGGVEVLDQARDVLADAPDPVPSALDTLTVLAEVLQHDWPELTIHVDLAELRGYQYHTGIVFAAYTPGSGQAVAKGGRYDDIGRTFGRPRPATGFSTDLRALLGNTGVASRTPARRGIYAPPAADAGRARAIADLRRAGERVVCALPGLPDAPERLGCDRVLRLREGGWVVEPLGTGH